MDELNNEIDKIQQEIDKDLFTIPTSGVDRVDESIISHEIIDNSETVENQLNQLNAFSREPDPTPIIIDKENINNDLYLSQTFKHETKKKENGKFKRTIALVVIGSILGGSFIGIGFGIASSIYNNYFISDSKASENTESESVSFSFDKQVDEVSKNTNSSSNSSVTHSYSDIYKIVEPSVVGITSDVSATNIYNMQQLMPVSGSGILFFESESKYYIATNYHVIEGAANISISISDSPPIPATPIGGDPANDLAVIYINKKDVTTAGVKKVVIAKFGNSDETQIGDVVLAIGNALGEGNSLTSGVISANAKQIDINEEISLTMLQTDASINPGNSGGPLINLKGEVIGINTAKVIDPNAEGMGYSIPSNIAQPIIQNFMDTINKPFIGVVPQTITEEFAKQYNLPSAGAYIENVIEDSPAFKAGIKRTDLITGFNGEPIFSAEQLIEAVGKCSIGDEVEIKIIRGGTESVTIKLILEKRL